MNLAKIITKVALETSMTNAMGSAFDQGEQVALTALDAIRPKPEKIRVGLFRHEYRNRRGQKCDKYGKVKKPSALEKSIRRWNK